MVLLSRSPGDTRRIGTLLASRIGPGMVLCLDGEMGTGKTVLVQGIADGLGYRGMVPSPTFLLIREYPEVRLCHVDAFRLSGERELVEAGIDEYLESGWTCAVEWAQNVRGALPADALQVKMEYGSGENDRVLSFPGSGKWSELVPELRKEGEFC